MLFSRLVVLYGDEAYLAQLQKFLTPGLGEEMVERMVGAGRRNRGVGTKSLAKR